MHNIKRHGKHLKDDVHIKNYSNCISIFKDSLRKVNDVTVIYNSKVRYSVIDNKKVYFYKIMYDFLINHNTNKIRERIPFHMKKQNKPHLVSQLLSSPIKNFLSELQPISS